MSPTMTPVEQVDFTFYYILGISAFILVGITVAMLVFVFKYSRSKNPHPSDIRGNWLLELIWTAIPTAIALSMFYFGWTSYLGLRNVPPGAIEIEVEGQMFSWLFTYPNDKETSEEMVVPVGKPIKLNITSSDVLHSFYVPAFRIKVDAVPGMTTYAWFLPKEVGEYRILCTEYCGTGHADMMAELKVVSEAEYAEWLEEDE